MSSSSGTSSYGLPAGVNPGLPPPGGGIGGGGSGGGGGGGGGGSGGAFLKNCLMNRSIGRDGSWQGRVDVLMTAFVPTEWELSEETLKVGDVEGGSICPTIVELSLFDPRPVNAYFPSSERLLDV